MTSIKSIIKTYTQNNAQMVHTGYFVLTNNYPMKYATKWQWESIKPSHLDVYLDRVIQSLPNAQ